MAACRSKALPLYSGVLAVLGHRLSGSDAAWRRSPQESDRAGWPGGPHARGAGGPLGRAKFLADVIHRRSDSLLTIYKTMYINNTIIITI